MQDALSDILKHIRLESCVYFQRDFHAPWAMRIAGTGFAQFHVITRGACVVIVEGQPHDCLAGDILLFPHGAAHVLADRPDRQAIDGPEVMASFAGDAPYFATGGPPARLICGHYENQPRISHPLLEELPDFIHVRGMDELGQVSNVTVLPLILSEMAGDKPGGTQIVERYAEILLIQTLRLHYARSPAKAGFFAGLENPRLARAVSRIHREFSTPLSLADLAETAAMSRSSFAHHFKQVTNISPIEYLARWRMIKAGEVLRGSDDPVAVVAEHVGYDSDISFSRAFKREYGITPARFRRSGQDASP